MRRGEPDGQIFNHHTMNRPSQFEEAPSIENGAMMRKSPKFSPEVIERAVRTTAGNVKVLSQQREEANHCCEVNTDQKASE